MSNRILEGIHALSDYFSEYAKEETALAAGSFCKHAIQYLTFEKVCEKTHLTDNFSQYPAMVIHPIYLDEKNPGLPYILLSTTSGGIVQGDRHEYKFTLGEEAEAVITEAAATKIYKMVFNYASKFTDIFLSKNSRLEYVPQEIIAYERSRWYQCTTFHVQESSKFLYSEIICPGRIAHNNEFWDFDAFFSKLIIEENGRLILFDSAAYSKKEKPVIETLLAGNTFMLNTYWFSKKANTFKEELSFDGVFGGSTEMPFGKGIVIKALSKDLDLLKRFQHRVWNTFRNAEAGNDIPHLRMY